MYVQPYIPVQRPEPLAQMCIRAYSVGTIGRVCSHRRADMYRPMHTTSRAVGHARRRQGMLDASEDDVGDATAEPDGACEPDAGDPDATDPDATDPDAADPDAGDPDAADPGRICST